MRYDVFNGDADGICALHQLRLAEPAPEARLVTGVKRDITLLSRIAELTGCSITVLDVSLDSNRSALDRLLQAGNSILYVDHHYAGIIPENNNLYARIDYSADQCTSLIVNTLLSGRFSKWAICGAFGDNLHAPATQMGSSLGLGEDELARLREVGELINYNGYGATLEDLHFHPAHLYRSLGEFEDPLDFHAASETLPRLRDGFREDMAQALGVKAAAGGGTNRVYFFPTTPWARRVAGLFSNLKSRELVDTAHAVLIANADTTFQVSVRAPLTNRRDADALCRTFPTGGGRAAAAGINRLPADMVDTFLSAFNAMYP
ncbi:MAG: acetyltransferase [Desulfocapsaceae bacterium]|nr:acetyltransferase [Desulfocapsaceae bacterium]